MHILGMWQCHSIIMLSWPFSIMIIDLICFQPNLFYLHHIIIIIISVSSWSLPNIQKTPFYKPWVVSSTPLSASPSEEEETWSQWRWLWYIILLYYIHHITSYHILLSPSPSEKRGWDDSLLRSYVRYGVHHIFQILYVIVCISIWGGRWVMEIICYGVHLRWDR